MYNEFIYKLWLKTRRFCVVALIGLIAFSYIYNYLFE